MSRPSSSRRPGAYTTAMKEAATSPIGGGLFLSGVAIFAAMQAPTLPPVAAAILAPGVTLELRPGAGDAGNGRHLPRPGFTGVAYGMYLLLYRALSRAVLRGRHSPATTRSR